jgi:micrococcal nuclease
MRAVRPKRPYRAPGRGIPKAQHIKYYVTLASIAAAAVLGLFSFSPKSPQEKDFSAVRVVHVYDGDTFRIATGERVRLIGIDCPESHANPKLSRDAVRTGQDARTIMALGREAYLFTRSLVEGRDVRLEFDVERRDKYGRLLAYAYLSDGTFVNAEIIKNGYASPMTIPPNVAYADDFKEYFVQAREASRGLWARPGAFPRRLKR